MQPSLAVIIVTYNAEAFIAECLRSVTAQECGASVVVIDNASTDATCALVRAAADAGVNLISSAANVGFAAANNIGLRQTTAELVLLLNPDTTMHPGALNELVGFMAEHPAVGVAGPRLLNADGSPQRTGMAFPSPWNIVTEIAGLDRLAPRSRLFGGHRRLYLDPDRPCEPDYLQGSCLMIRRAVFEQIGLLDDRFFMYFEETDLCRRAHDAGWTVAYVPGAVVTHLGGGGSASYSGDRLRDFHRSYLRYLRKHETALRRLAMRLLLVVRALLRAGVLAVAGLGFSDRRAAHRDRARGYWASAGIMGGWMRS